MVDNSFLLVFLLVGLLLSITTFLENEICGLQLPREPYRSTRPLHWLARGTVISFTLRQM